MWTLECRRAGRPCRVTLCETWADLLSTARGYGIAWAVEPFVGEAGTCEDGDGYEYEWKEVEI